LAILPDCTYTPRIIHDLSAVTAANWITNNLAEAIRQLCFDVAPAKVPDVYPLQV
jgi:hypothetical protein